MTEETELETPADNIPSNALCYIIELDSFVARRGGRFSTATLMNETAARNHLSQLGYGAESIRGYIKDMRYLKAQGFTMEPAAGETLRGPDGLIYVNAYVPPTINPEPGSFDLINRTLDFLTGGDELGKEWLLNWSAAKAQNPIFSPQTALILSGAQGTGKSTYACTIMPAIIGEDNCCIINQQSLEGSFTSHFASKLWINADEATSSTEAFEVANRLKTWISSSTIDYHAKGRPVVRIPNRTSFTFTTNAQVPVRLDSDDRRHTAFVQRRTPEASYTLALKEAHQGKQITPAFQREIEAFAAFLLEWKVDTLKLATAHDSEAKRAIQKLSRPSYEDFFEEVQTDGLHAVIADVTGVTRGYHEYKLGADRVAVTQPNGRLMVEQSVLKSDLLKLYSDYCDANGLNAYGSKKFREYIESKGAKDKRIDNRRYYTLTWLEAPDTLPVTSRPDPDLSTRN